MFVLTFSTTCIDRQDIDTKLNMKAGGNNRWVPNMIRNHDSTSSYEKGKSYRRHIENCLCTYTLCRSKHSKKMEFFILQKCTRSDNSNWSKYKLYFISCMYTVMWNQTNKNRDRFVICYGLWLPCIGCYVLEVGSDNVFVYLIQIIINIFHRNLEFLNTEVINRT